jgi:hypothetical protein
MTRKRTGWSSGVVSLKIGPREDVDLSLIPDF